MRKTLRAAVALTTALSIWSIVHFGSHALVDGAAAQASQSPPIGLLLLTLSIPAGLALLARSGYRSRGSLPSNVEDLPDIIRTIVRDDGADEEWLTPALCGAALGVSGAVLTSGPELRAGVLGAAVVMSVLAFAMIREERASRRESAELHDRIERLRGYGNRAIADVIETGFGRTWFHGGPVIRVTARFHTADGIRTVTDDVVTEPADAPTPGGTVLVWYIGDGARRRDFYIEQDPDSVREPGAAQRYEPPDGGS